MNPLAAPPTRRLVPLAGLLCLAVALAARRVERPADLVRIKPHDFAKEQSALASPTVREVDVVRMLAAKTGTSFDEAVELFLAQSRTPEQRRQGSLPPNLYVAERTANRALPADGPEWQSFFANFPFGSGWEDRLCDVAGIRSFFFAPTEDPVRRAASQIQPGQTLWLQAADAWYEAYRLSPGQLRGPETGLHDFPGEWQVPDRFRYPWRPLARRLALLGALLLVAPPLARWLAFLCARGAEGRPDFRNPEKRVAAAWTLVGLAAAAVCFLPLWPEGSGMRGGFAVRTVAGVLALVGTLVVYFYSRRAAQLDRLLAGDGLLVHWSYAEDEWTRFAERDRIRDAARTRALLGLMAFFFVAIGGGFWALDPEAGRATFAIMLLLLAIVGLCGWAATAGRARAARNAPREAFLSRDCAWVGGRFHSWTGLGARFESARASGSDPMEIEIEYSVPGRYSRSSWTFRLPVPRGQESNAAHVAANLRRRPSKPAPDS